MGRGGNGQKEVTPLSDSVQFRTLVGVVKAYAVFLISVEGRILSWNPGVEAILGYPEGEFVGREAEMIFTPEDRQAGVPGQELAQAAEEGEASDNRWHVRRDGSLFFAKGVVTSVWTESGRLQGFLKILRDNTAYREARDALQQAYDELERRVEERTALLKEALERLKAGEAMFSEIFRAGPFAAVLVDARDERLHEANEAFVQLSGYRRSEIVGRTAAELGLWPEEGNQGKLDRLCAGEDGQPNLELTLARSDGERRQVLASCVSIPRPEGRFLLKMLVDITERKRAEDDLREAIQDVMQDASWFSRSVVERLAELRSGAVDRGQITQLTRRERQVLELVARGLSNADIAAELGIAPQTVRNYITAVYEKIGARSRVEAVVWARERGLGL